MKKYILFTTCYLLLFHNGFSQEFKNIVYAKSPKRELVLDLYLPKTVINAYLVVWIHGGAWHSGSKENPPKELLNKGYALASIDFRTSLEDRFKASVYDIKAAIRFLRGNSQKYGYKKDKIIIWGASSGGHLASLVGLTNGNTDFEGNLGNYLEESSNVNLIIDFYGPSNLNTILAQSTPHGLSVRAPALALLLGAPIEQVKPLADMASPINHIDKTDPPVFIAHGNQDIQVPVNQSLELFAKLNELGLKTEIEIIQNQGHGGPKFSEDALINKLIKFIEESL